MTINRLIEKRKQTTPKEMIKKNIFKEIKKQKTPKEIKTNKKPNKKRKQKTPKEIKLAPKTIEQRGGTINPLLQPMVAEPVQVVAESVKPTNNSTGVPNAKVKSVNESILVEAKPMPQNNSQPNTQLVEAESRNASNIPVASYSNEGPNGSLPKAQLVEASEVNIPFAEPKKNNTPNALSGESQQKTIPQNNSQPNTIPQNNSQQKSSIMTESEFMKKYEITETQIKQVKLLLSNAFAA